MVLTGPVIRRRLALCMAAFLIDNVLMSVQFAYSCTYYSERLKIYAGDDIFQKDDFVIENILRFVKAALKPQKYPERIEQI